MNTTLGAIDRAKNEMCVPLGGDTLTIALQHGFSCGEYPLGLAWITILKVFTRFDAVGGVVWQKWKSMLPWLPGVSGMSERGPGARGQYGAFNSMIYWE